MPYRNYQKIQYREQEILMTRLQVKMLLALLEHKYVTVPELYQLIGDRKTTLKSTYGNLHNLQQKLAPYGILIEEIRLEKKYFVRLT